MNSFLLIGAATMAPGEAGAFDADQARADRPRAEAA